MAWWNDLNSFDSTLDLGDDFSARYVQNKNAYFYIAKEGLSGELLAFKPFIKDMTYSLNVKTEDIISSIQNANPAQAITGVDLMIKVSMEMPAVSVNESIANAGKIRTLMGWLRPKKYNEATKKKNAPSMEWCKAAISKVPTKGSGKQIDESKLSAARLAKIKRCMSAYGKGKKTKNPPVDSGPGGVTKANGKKAEEKKSEKNIVIDVQKLKKAIGSGYSPSFTGKQIVLLVSFANLIQSGRYTELHQIMNSSSKKTHKHMSTYGLRCFMTNAKDDVNLDMGFFESNGELYPKAHTLTFDLHLINSDLTGVKSNILGFGNLGKGDAGTAGGGYSRGPYHQNDIKTWPFGVSSAKDVPGFEDRYTKQNNGTIKFKKWGVNIEYLPLLKSFSIERKIDNKNIQEFRHLTGKNRLVFDAKMPIYNLGFTVASHNLAQARFHHLQLQKLMRMIMPAEGGTTTSTAEMSVKFANLISNGQIYENEGEFVRCVCTKLSVKPNPELGYFEDKGMLFMKSFDLSFSLEVNDMGFKN